MLSFLRPDSFVSTSALFVGTRQMIEIRDLNLVAADSRTHM